MGPTFLSLVFMARELRLREGRSSLQVKLPGARGPSSPDTRALSHCLTLGSLWKVPPHVISLFQGERKVTLLSVYCRISKSMEHTNGKIACWMLVASL